MVHNSIQSSIARVAIRVPQSAQVVSVFVDDVVVEVVGQVVVDGQKFVVVPVEAVVDGQVNQKVMESVRVVVKDAENVETLVVQKLVDQAVVAAVQKVVGKDVEVVCVEEVKVQDELPVGSPGGHSTQWEV